MNRLYGALIVTCVVLVGASSVAVAQGPSGRRGEKTWLELQTEKQKRRAEERRARFTNEIHQVELLMEGLRADERKVEDEMRQAEEAVIEADATRSRAVADEEFKKQQHGDAAERARRRYIREQVARLQGVEDERRRLAQIAFDDDQKYISNHKVMPADLPGRTLSFDPDDPSKALRFVATPEGPRAFGVVYTVDFATGQKRWHPLPAEGGAAYSVAPDRKNPFVAVITVSAGSDFLGTGSNDPVDWNVVIYALKAVDGPNAGEFEHMALRWLGHCDQPKVVPNHPFKPEPQATTVTADDERVQALVEDWEFVDPGLDEAIQNAVNARIESEKALKLAEYNKRRVLRKVNRSKNRIEEEMVELEADLEKLQGRLEDLEGTTDEL